MARLNTTELQKVLTIVLRVNDCTQKLRTAILCNAKRSNHPQLLTEQSNAGSIAIKDHRTKQLPVQDAAIEGMIAMLWHMPYVQSPESMRTCRQHRSETSDRNIG